MIYAPNRASNIVNLSEGTCTCLDFQDKNLPCRHAILACREFNLEPEVYTSQVYSLNSYQNTYKIPMPPICLEDLESSLDCLLPLLSKRPGRPFKKCWERKKSKIFEHSFALIVIVLVIIAAIASAIFNFPRNSETLPFGTLISNQIITIVIVKVFLPEMSGMDFLTMITRRSGADVLMVKTKIEIWKEKQQIWSTISWLKYWLIMLKMNGADFLMMENNAEV